MNNSINKLESFEKYVQSKYSVKAVHTIVIQVHTSKDISELAEKIASRAETMDGVEFAEVLSKGERNA